MLGASSFYLLTRALNGPWRHGPRRRLGFRSLAGSLPTRAPADSEGHLKGRRVRDVQTTAMRSLGRNLEAFEARTLLRVNADTLGSRRLRVSNLLERGGSTQKSRPRRLSTKNAPEVPKTLPNLAGARSIMRLYFPKPAAERRKCYGMDFKEEPALEGVSRQTLEAQKRPALSTGPEGWRRP